MFGPVFSLEVLASRRRGRSALFRRLWAGWLLIQFTLLMLVHWPRAGTAPEVWRFSSLYIYILQIQYFGLICLAVPAFVAGAITDEKVKRTLHYLLVADLTSAEIVLGKLMNRLAQVIGLAVVSWPLFGFVGGYGHWHWPVFVCLLAVTLILAVFVGGLSMVLSLYSKQTRSAVLNAYLMCGLLAVICGSPLDWALAIVKPSIAPGSWVAKALVPTAEFLRCLDPLHVLAPVWDEFDLPKFAGRLQYFAAVYLSLGSLFVTWSVMRFRPSLRKQMAERKKPEREGPRRSEVSDDPVRWRERLPSSRIVRWGGAIIVLVLSGLTVIAAVNEQDIPMLFWLAGIGGFLLSVVVAIRASGAVSGEREAQTWESLLITPLDSWDLVIDKQVGCVQSIGLWFAGLGLPIVALSWKLGWLAWVLSLYLLLFFWVYFYYIAAVGILCSVRARSSWRGLVSTLVMGYGYFLGMSSLLAFLYLWVGFTIGALVFFFLALMGIRATDPGVVFTIAFAILTMLGWLLRRSGNNRISDAKTWIDANERYGRTFVRSLTRALIKHARRQEEKQAERQAVLQ